MQIGPKQENWLQMLERKITYVPDGDVESSMTIHGQRSIQNLLWSESIDLADATRANPAKYLKESV